MAGMQKTIGRDDLGRQQAAAVRRDLVRAARGATVQTARIDRSELLSRMKAVQSERAALVPDWVPAFLLRPIRIEMAGE